MKRGLDQNEAKSRILKLFEHNFRPVLIGAAAIELKWPLSWVEALFDELVHEKRIRQCNTSEKSTYDITYGFFLVK